MFQQLSKYLLQFHAISIPGVGTIELVQQPARLDIVEKLIFPPQYATRFSTTENVSQHQLDYLSVELNTDQSEAQRALNNFGTDLLNRAKNEEVKWTGIGTFSYNGNLHFIPEVLQPLLQPVQAEKVLRENVQHSVLVGDQVVYSDGNEVFEAPSSTNIYKIIGWIAAALAIAFIVYYLYQHQFSATASGSQMKVETAAPAPTYK